MIARENAKTAGIIWDRFVKTEFGREIGDRAFDGTARPGFSVSVLATQIFLERLEDLPQLAEKGFILRDFLEARLPRKLKHAHWVVICPIPKLRIELPKKAAGRGLPCPPQIETHLAQRLERRRQGRSHIVSLKSRHVNQQGETERQLIEKSLSGKFRRIRPEPAVED